MNRCGLKKFSVQLIVYMDVSLTQTKICIRYFILKAETISQYPPPKISLRP